MQNSIPIKIAQKRFSRSLKSKAKAKAKRILNNLVNLTLKTELGSDKSLNNQLEKWLPESIKYILSKADEKYLKYSDKIVDDKNNLKIFVPKTFCLLQNADKSYDFIYTLLFAIVSDVNKIIEIDYSKCRKIEISAQIFLDIILKDSLKFLRKKAKYRSTQPNLQNIRAVNVKNKEIKKILFSIGSPAILNKTIIKYPDIIPYKLCVHSKTSNNIENIRRKEIDTTELVDHVIESLRVVGKELNSENIENLSTVIGEILINAEEHSTINYRYSTGYFQRLKNHDQKKFYGIYHLVLMNFGETIYEKFLSPQCVNHDIKNKMKSTSDKYLKSGWFSKSFEEETLWTLYALQEGITSVSTQKFKRGNGSIRFIESFFNLKTNSYITDNISKMAIISGNTNIIFDGTYVIENKSVGLDSFKVMTFNKSGDIDNKPDRKFVKFVDNYFPGTIIYAKILITQDDINNEQNND